MLPLRRLRYVDLCTFCVIVYIAFVVTLRCWFVYVVTLLRCLFCVVVCCCCCRVAFTFLIVLRCRTLALRLLFTDFALHDCLRLLRFATTVHVSHAVVGTVHVPHYVGLRLFPRYVWVYYVPVRFCLFIAFTCCSVVAFVTFDFTLFVVVALRCILFPLRIRCYFTHVGFTAVLIYADSAFTFCWICVRSVIIYCGLIVRYGFYVTAPHCVLLPRYRLRCWFAQFYVYAAFVRLRLFTLRTFYVAVLIPTLFTFVVTFVVTFVALRCWFTLYVRFHTFHLHTRVLFYAHTFTTPSVTRLRYYSTYVCCWLRALPRLRYVPLRCTFWFHVYVVRCSLPLLLPFVTYLPLRLFTFDYVRCRSAVPRSVVAAHSRTLYSFTICYVADTLLRVVRSHVYSTFADCVALTVTRVYVVPALLLRSCCAVVRCALRCYVAHYTTLLRWCCRSFPRFTFTRSFTLPCVTRSLLCSFLLRLWNVTFCDFVAVACCTLRFCFYPTLPVYIVWYILAVTVVAVTTAHVRTVYSCCLAIVTRCLTPCGYALRTRARCWFVPAVYIHAWIWLVTLHLLPCRYSYGWLLLILLRHVRYRYTHTPIVDYTLIPTLLFCGLLHYVVHWLPYVVLRLLRYVTARSVGWLPTRCCCTFSLRLHGYCSCAFAGSALLFGCCLHAVVRLLDSVYFGCYYVADSHYAFVARVLRWILFGFTDYVRSRILAVGLRCLVFTFVVLDTRCRYVPTLYFAFTTLPLYVCYVRCMTCWICCWTVTLRAFALPPCTLRIVTRLPPVTHAHRLDLPLVSVLALWLRTPLVYRIIYVDSRIAVVVYATRCDFALITLRCYVPLVGFYYALFPFGLLFVCYRYGFCLLHIYTCHIYPTLPLPFALHFIYGCWCRLVVFYDYVYRLLPLYRCVVYAFVALVAFVTCCTFTHRLPLRLLPVRYTPVVVTFVTIAVTFTLFGCPLRWFDYICYVSHLIAFTFVHLLHTFTLLRYVWWYTFYRTFTRAFAFTFVVTLLPLHRYSLFVRYVTLIVVARLLYTPLFGYAIVYVYILMTRCYVCYLYVTFVHICLRCLRCLFDFVVCLPVCYHYIYAVVYVALLRCSLLLILRYRCLLRCRYVFTFVVVVVVVVPHVCLLHVYRYRCTFDWLRYVVALRCYVVVVRCSVVVTLLLLLLLLLVEFCCCCCCLRCWFIYLLFVTHDLLRCYVLRCLFTRYWFTLICYLLPLWIVDLRSYRYVGLPDYALPRFIAIARLHWCYDYYVTFGFIGYAFYVYAHGCWFVGCRFVTLRYICVTFLRGTVYTFALLRCCSSSVGLHFTVLHVYRLIGLGWLHVLLVTRTPVDIARLRFALALLYVAFTRFVTDCAPRSTAPRLHFTLITLPFHIYVYIRLLHLCWFATIYCLLRYVFIVTYVALLRWFGLYFRSLPPPVVVVWIVRYVLLRFTRYTLLFAHWRLPRCWRLFVRYALLYCWLRLPLRCYICYRVYVDCVADFVILLPLRCYVTLRCCIWIVPAVVHWFVTTYVLCLQLRWFVPHDFTLRYRLILRSAYVCVTHFPLFVPLFVGAVYVWFTAILHVAFPLIYRYVYVWLRCTRLYVVVTAFARLVLFVYGTRCVRCYARYARVYVYTVSPRVVTLLRLFTVRYATHVLPTAHLLTRCCRYTTLRFDFHCVWMPHTLVRWFALFYTLFTRSVGYTRLRSVGFALPRLPRRVYYVCYVFPCVAFTFCAARLRCWLHLPLIYAFVCDSRLRYARTFTLPFIVLWRFARSLPLHVYRVVALYVRLPLLMHIPVTFCCTAFVWNYVTFCIVTCCCSLDYVYCHARYAFCCSYVDLRSPHVVVTLRYVLRLLRFAICCWIVYLRFITHFTFTRAFAVTFLHVARLHTVLLLLLLYTFTFCCCWVTIVVTLLICCWRYGVTLRCCSCCCTGVLHLPLRYCVVTVVIYVVVDSPRFTTFDSRSFAFLCHTFCWICRCGYVRSYTFVRITVGATLAYVYLYVVLTVLVYVAVCYTQFDSAAFTPFTFCCVVTTAFTLRYRCVFCCCYVHYLVRYVTFVRYVRFVWLRLRVPDTLRVTRCTRCCTILRWTCYKRLPILIYVNCRLLLRLHFVALVRLLPFTFYVCLRYLPTLRFTHRIVTLFTRYVVAIYAPLLLPLHFVTFGVVALWFVTLRLYCWRYVTLPLHLLPCYYRVRSLLLLRYALLRLLPLHYLRYSFAVVTPDSFFYVWIRLHYYHLRAPYTLYVYRTLTFTLFHARLRCDYVWLRYYPFVVALRLHIRSGYVVVRCLVTRLRVWFATHVVHFTRLPLDYPYAHAYRWLRLVYTFTFICVYARVVTLRSCSTARAPVTFPVWFTLWFVSSHTACRVLPLFTWLPCDFGLLLRWFCYAYVTFVAVCCTRCRCRILIVPRVYTHVYVCWLPLLFVATFTFAILRLRSHTAAFTFTLPLPDLRLLVLLITTVAICLYVLHYVVWIRDLPVYRLRSFTPFTLVPQLVLRCSVLTFATLRLPRLPPLPYTHVHGIALPHVTFVRYLPLRLHLQLHVCCHVGVIFVLIYCYDFRPLHTLPF